MPNWTQGASGAASGAALGSTFGPWGTGIGAVAGGLLGMFGGGGANEQAERERRRQIALANQGAARAEQRLDDAESQTATTSDLYTQGLGALLDNLSRQRRSDEASAAARGAGGTERELATTSSRQQSLATGTRGLISDASRQVEAQKRAALARYLQALGMRLNTGMAQQQIDQQQANRQQQGLASSAALLMSALQDPQQAQA